MCSRLEAANIEHSDHTTTQCQCRVLLQFGMRIKSKLEKILNPTAKGQKALVIRLFEFNLGIYDLRATSSICIQILSALQFSCETQTRRSRSSIPFIKIHVSVPARKEASVSPPLDKLQVTLIRKNDKTWHRLFVNPLITLIFTPT